jgi:oligopeptide transport system permease protein
MGRYVLRRLLQLIPVFLGTTFIIYTLVWAIPVDPFAGKCGQRPCPPAYVAAMRAKFNLDDNLFVQYVKYLGRLFTGDFGQTFAGTEVSTLIANAYPITLRLAVVALVIEALVGMTAGVLTGLRKNGFADNLVLVATLMLISLPVFVTGYILRGLFGTPRGTSFVDLIVPGIVLGSLSMAYVSRLTRTSIAENRRADFVRTAIAKGLPTSRVVGVHLLRNSVIPVITFLGTDLGAQMGGEIVTEGVFNIRGIGGLVFTNIQQQQGVVVTGVVTLLVLVYLVMSLVVDLLYAVLDPRIRYE